MKKSARWFPWTVSLTAAFALIPCTASFAQNGDSVAEREAARRQAALPRGEEALGRAKAAMAAGNYPKAYEEFRLALSFLPDAVISEKAHDEALRGFCESGLKVAEQKMAAGDSAGAQAICREILSDRYDPNCRGAAEMLARLDQPVQRVQQPIRVSDNKTTVQVNRTVSSNFAAKVEEVRRLLAAAEEYYMSGRYDLAFKKYEQVLALDPYNVAARRGQERLNLTKTHYGEEAYNETRSRQLWQVDSNF